MSDVTQILSSLEQGNLKAADQLLPLVYEELRRLAARKLANESPGQTLQATALVHEAYLRLVGDIPDRPWDGRGHFFAAAAEAMRRILVDRARRKARKKRGGGLRRVDLTDTSAPDPDEDLLALDDALKPAGGRGSGRGQGDRAPPVRRPGARGDRDRPWNHRLPRPPEMELRPGLAPRRHRRLNRFSGKIRRTSANGARMRNPETRTIRCRSTRNVSRPCSVRPLNATPPRTGPPCWTVSARPIRSCGNGSRRC